MGQRIIRVSGELIRQVLKLPDDCRVTGLSEHLFFASDEWAIRFESPEFPDVPPGNLIPVVGPVYQTKWEGERFMGAELVGWEGLDKSQAATCVGIDFGIVPPVEVLTAMPGPAMTAAPVAEPPTKFREFF